MRATFIAHSCVLVEANGIAILSDPWWQGPCFGAQWWVYPEPYVAAVSSRKIDYIYISHGHHDHLHPGTLSTLDRSAKILVSAELDLAGGLRDMGFEVLEIASDEEIDLGSDVRVRICVTYGDDSFLAISDGSEVLVNLNDSLHSAPRQTQEHYIKFLRRTYVNIDYLFCGYGVASHFPNCYVIPGKDRVLTAAKRQSYFNKRWVDIVAALQPKFGFPFAADVVFLEQDLFWANEPTHNSERPVDLFRKQVEKSSTQVHDIAPGFSIEDGLVKNLVIRRTIDNEKIAIELRDQIVRANRYGAGSNAQLSEVFGLVEKAIASCTSYLLEFRGSYRILLRMRVMDSAIAIEKAGSSISARIVDGSVIRDSDYDLIFTTRLAYLKNSLTTAYGHEIIFVGSGGIFEYSQRDAVKRRVHSELIALLRSSVNVPKSRYGAQSYTKFMAKNLVKKILRRGNQTDMYDLDAWTVYS